MNFMNFESLISSGHKRINWLFTTFCRYGESGQTATCYVLLTSKVFIRKWREQPETKQSNVCYSRLLGHLDISLSVNSFFIGST